MGQFKPMVKMETTEPSVELKLKKGGHVNMKKGGKAEAGHKKMAMGGGAMGALAGTPALIGRPAVNAPVRAPGKPSMSMRRKAMMAKPAVTPSGPSMPAPAMKKGGMPMVMKDGKKIPAFAAKKGGMSKMAEGGKMDMGQDKAMIKKAFKQHDMQEHKGGKGTKLKLAKGGMKCATGGVTLGNAGGYKKGGMACADGGVMGNGVIPESMSAKGSKGYKNTMMKTAEYTGKSSGKTGGVKDGNGGGYKTGGVALGNAGGYKAGGKTSKKAYAAGGTVNSGRAVAMPEGRKPVPSSVKISQLAGTYKRGGKVTPAEAVLLKNNKAENKATMRDAMTNSNLKYGSPKRMAGGGFSSDKEMDMSKGAYDAHYAREKAENEADRKMMTDAFMYLPRQAKKAFNSLTGRGAMSDKEMGMPSSTKGLGSVTEREKSITVSPAGKKRGGRAC